MRSPTTRPTAPRPSATTCDSFYVQDEWQATPDIKVQAGVRMDMFSGSDKPLLNENFAGRYGFNNQSDARRARPLHAAHRLQLAVDAGDHRVRRLRPVRRRHAERVDLEQLLERRRHRRAHGRRSGPRPINPDLADALVGVDGFDIPQDVLDFNAAQRGDGPVNSIDPDFDVPSQYRWNLGVTHALPWDIELTADVIYSRVNDEVLWQDIRLQQVGTAPDGRPIYAPRADGRTEPERAGPPAHEYERGREHDLHGRGEQDLAHGAGRFDAYLGYGHQDVKDVNPGTSSTASSNWDNVAVSDPNDPGLETSNYEIAHRFNGTFQWTQGVLRRLRDEHRAHRRAPLGPPVTATRSAPARWSGATRARQSRQRHLFYVPDGDVIFEGACSAAELGVVAGCASAGDFSSASAAAAQFAADMDAYIEEQGLEKWRGRIMPRNSHRSPWVTSLDLRFAQELPIFRRTRGIVTFDIENFANLLNSDWGQLRQVSFPFVTPVADANRITTVGCPDGAPSCYVYRPRSGETGPVKPFNTISSLPSIWRMQLGFRIEF